MRLCKKRSDTGKKGNCREKARLRQCPHMTYKDCPTCDRDFAKNVAQLPPFISFLV